MTKWRTFVAYLAIGVVLFSCSVAAIHLWLYSGVVKPPLVVVPDLPPYGDGLRRLPPWGESPSAPDRYHAPPYQGPGWYDRRSPDGRYVAVTTSWGGVLSYTLLGLIVDRPYIHTVSVFDASERTLVPVISIKEADPASGIAHRYTWSSDSAALLIHGCGRLPGAPDEADRLCLVYAARTKVLYRLTSCPGGC